MVGKGYGDNSTPGTWYLENIRDTLGNSAAFTISNAVSDGNGYYLLTVAVTAAAPGAVSNHYGLKVAYVGSAAAPEGVTSPNFVVADTLGLEVTDQGGSGPGPAGMIKFADGQPDKVTLNAEITETLNYQVKLTDVNGAAVTNADPANFTVTGGVYSTGEPLTVNRLGAANAGKGFYTVALSVYGGSSGQLGVLGIRYAQNGVNYDISSTVAFTGTAGTAVGSAAQGLLLYLPWRCGFRQ